MELSFEFLNMLNTRICHDLAGPISATNNGIELMAMETDPMMQSQATELLQLSAGEAFTKLQFFRIAYGRTQDGGTSDWLETKEIIERFFKSTKVQLDWQVDGCYVTENNIPNHERKALVAALLVAAGVMVFGGALKVVRQEVANGGSRMVLEGEHTRMRESQEIMDIMQGSSPEYSPQNAPVFYLYFCLSHYKTVFNIDISETSFSLDVQFP